MIIEGQTLFNILIKNRCALVCAVLVLINCQKKHVKEDTLTNIERVIFYSIPEGVDWFIPITKNTIQNASYLKIDTIADSNFISKFEKCWNVLQCAEHIQTTENTNLIAMLLVNFNVGSQETLLVEAIRKNMYKNCRVCENNLELRSLLLSYFSRNVDFNSFK